MKVSVQKWGNSLAVRIPKAIANDIAVHAGSELDLVAVDGRLVATPARARRKSLAELLSGVTRRNLHDDQDAGGPIGREAL